MKHGTGLGRWLQRCGRGVRATLWSLTALLVLLADKPANAYPQFSLKGYGDCGSCHHSPSGGGLPNRWGLDSIDPTFAAASTWGNQDLTYTPGAPLELRVDLGADLRLMGLVGTDGDANVGPTLIPMLTELGGAAAVGRWTLYATGTARRVGGSAGNVLTSREHWLEYNVRPGVDLRIGRLVLPFGIRQPDHTQYVREDFELDKYDQSYAFEADVRSASTSVFASAFVGDLTGVARERQERGFVVTTTAELGGGAALGLSGLGSTSFARHRVAGSCFGRFPLVANLYLLAEIASQHFAQRHGDATLSTLAEYLRFGWFARPDLDVYLELGHRNLLNTEGLSKRRLGLGVNWQLFRWFELAPELLAEARSGLPARVLALGQVQLVY